MGKELEVGQAVPFVHLHLHTEYSLLDGAARLSANHASPLFEECIKRGMPGVAVTDHGNMMAAFTEYDLHKMYKKMMPEGRTFDVIYGCEFYFVDDMKNQSQKEERYHLVLLAKTEAGLKNLIKLNSCSWIDGFYYKPRIDMQLLEQHCEGLVCLSACLAGYIPQRLLHGQYEEAKKHALKLQSLFGKEDFYIELQDHGIKEERQILPLLAKLAKEIGAKCVATNDVHYVNKEDAKAQEVMMAIQTGARLSDEKRMKFDSDEFYLKSYEEMQQVFSWCPEALTNTIEILEKCKGLVFKEKQEEKLYPAYIPPDGKTPYEYLRELTFAGLKRRYKDKLDQAKIDRAETELNVIHTKGFDSYYLVVWDFINYSRSVDIPIGPGRGSGVGSIVAYAIGITNVEPLQFDLLFERFLNPERNSPPDFDIDICTERRQEVIEYVVKKYGRERVCQILTLGTLKAKNAIADVARVYDVPLDKVNRTKKTLPNDPKLTLSIALGLAKDKSGAPIPGNADFIDIYNNDPQMHEVIDMARKLEGMPKNCSMHAAGVVICNVPVTEEVPLLTARKKDKIDIITQFQKGELEAQGVLKMDFLGLITLTDIHHAIKYVKEDYGITIDFTELGVADKGVYDMICQGDTDLVFQLENGGMRKFMTQLQPRNIEDIIIGISLYRPGPMDSIPDFLEARNHPRAIEYADPCLKPILEATSGYFVYQEQVMNAARFMSTYTLGEADLLRRAMGKKKADEMAKQRVKFLEGAASKGIDKDVANSTFDKMEKFATYAFNKSHAAAYAHLSYQTAYLKKYYMVEFVCAYLNNRITKSDQLLKYIGMAKKHNIEILPADVNMSDVRFKVENGKVRFGLTAIKNIGEQVAEEIVKNRKENGKYKSLTDFVERLDVKVANKTTIENLTKAGAMDVFGHTRATIIANYPAIISKVAIDNKNKQSGQMSLFDIIEDSKEEKLTEVEEYSKLEVLAMEKEVLNTFMTGHPLDVYKKELSHYEFNLNELSPLLNNKADDSEENGDDDDSVDSVVGDETEREEEYAELEELCRLYDKKNVVVAGLLENFVKKKKKDGSFMGVGALEDLYNSISVVFTTKVYETYKNILKDDIIVEISGRLNAKDGEVSLMASKVKVLEKDNNQNKANSVQSEAKGRIIYILGDDNEDLTVISNRLCRIVGGRDSGNDVIKIQYKKKLYNYPNKVNCPDVTELRLRDAFGENNIKIVNT